MQSVQPEDEKKVVDEALESRNHVTEVGYAHEAEASPGRRNKRSARCYYMTMAVVYLVLLVGAVVALANFGIRQAEINQMKDKFYFQYHPQKTCILFAEHTDDVSQSNRFITALHSTALCGYVLWGLISVTIVAFVWLVYNVVLAAIGPKM